MAYCMAIVFMILRSMSFHPKLGATNMIIQDKKDSLL